MSPIITATPAPVPFWNWEISWPHFLQADDELPGSGGSFTVNHQHYRPMLTDPNNSAPFKWDGQGAGGTGATKQHERHFGMPYVLRYGTTAAICHDMFKPPFLPSLADPGATMGAHVGREDYRCVWWRFVETRAVGGAGDGTCGNVFSYANAQAGNTWAQGGSLVQQHGLYGNGAGGVEYRSYSAAAALLETVPLPGYLLGAWNTIDHIFISSAVGRVPSYQLVLNGVSVVARNFGSAALPFSAGMRQQIQWKWTTAGTWWYLAYMIARAGRFTPDGRELRS